MSARPKKKPDAQKETAPAVTDPVVQLKEQLKEMLEGFQKVRPDDGGITAKNKRRLHGVGIKTLGFIERAFASAKSFPDFAPHYLNTALLDGKFNELMNIMSLKEVLKQFADNVETTYLLISNDCYQNALTYYESLKEAVKMRESCAETVFKELQPFFKSHKSKPSPSKLRT
jgi:hypothetical protein